MSVYLNSHTIMDEGNQSITFTVKVDRLAGWDEPFTIVSSSPHHTNRHGTTERLKDAKTIANLILTLLVREYEIKRLEAKLLGTVPKKEPEQ